MTFNQWLEKELTRIDHGDGYDPEGDSPRAIVERMKKSKLKALWWEYKQVWKDVKYEVTSWKGLDTSLATAIVTVLSPLAVTLLPPIRIHFRYRKALQDFRIVYLTERVF